jgi:CheY-like chemotaxis protein
MNRFILCVEDDPVIGHFLSRLLAKVDGALVEHVANNADALSAISVRCPDLIVSDIVHMGPSGIELFDVLRADPKTASIPFVFVSGQITRDPDLELRLFRKGAEGAFPKPFATEELIVCVKRILREPFSPEVDLLLLGLESRDLDYKEDLDLESKAGRASIAKDFIGMANVGGGTIIVGVRESKPGVFKLVGVPDERLAFFETTRLNDLVRPYIGAAFAVSSHVTSYRSHHFVFIRVPSSGDTLAMPVSSHERASLFTGRIYGRTNAARTEEVRDSLEVSQLLDRIVGDRVRRLLTGRG